jgi:hypothetical protein
MAFLQAMDEHAKQMDVVFRGGHPLWISSLTEARDFARRAGIIRN